MDTGAGFETAGRVAGDQRDSDRGDAPHTCEYGRSGDHVRRNAAGSLSVPVTGDRRHALATAHALEAEASGEHDDAAHLHAAAATQWAHFTNVVEQAHASLGQARCLTRLADAALEQPLCDARELFTRIGARTRVAECDSLIAQTAKLGS